jgi:hypothetical protein
MVDEVLVNKADIIEKCILRIRDVYQSDFENLSLDQTKQDSIILNLERAQGQSDKSYFQLSIG